MSLGAQSNIKTEVVEYKDGETVLQGYLAYDALLTGKRPGVLIVHEWYEHNDSSRQLAGAFYQDRQVMRQRAAAGLKVLQDHPLTDSNRIAAIGFCFGGTTVLELARGGLE